MGKINLLDCTLRDGGYINDWNFGNAQIKNIIKKLCMTGIDYIEVGFLKNVVYDPDKTLFPDIETAEKLLTDISDKTKFVVMVDMSSPVPIDTIPSYNGGLIDGIRVIFKKNKLSDGFCYCDQLLKKGYRVFANFVSTDSYSDKEFIEAIELFNKIRPTGVTIVDTFGSIKRKQFRRLLMLADNNLNPDIMLCYHAHNNLQQAMSNAEYMAEMNLKRQIIIDACVFGMGRGAGNLNLELFAEYMNENMGTSYHIPPMLEIMDENLSVFYRTKFWGYSLPLYLSASLSLHPNYAIYYAEKNTLPTYHFYELLKTISDEDKYVFTRETAEKYYREFFKNFVDDSEAIKQLEKEFAGKEVLLIAPGKSIIDYADRIKSYYSQHRKVVLLNFFKDDFLADYIFVSNMRRFNRQISFPNCRIIATSNISENIKSDYIVNFVSYTGNKSELFDNSGLMLLRLLSKIGVKKIYIAGMDGYSSDYGKNYFDSSFEATHLSVADYRNQMIKNELNEIATQINLTFITPSAYQ